MIDQAILKTLAYADVFNFPLKLDEIQRYLPVQATIDEVQGNLIQVLLPSGQVECHDGYYFLPGRTKQIEMRLDRETSSRAMWPQAEKYGQSIGSLPFVKMVAVTGSLAAHNLVPDGDVDYLVVTEPGRLWLSRLFIVALVRWAARDGITICPNYIVSENALSFTPRNLFSARELAQMVPVYGVDVYQQLRRANQWTHQYFPNAQDAPRHQLTTKPVVSPILKSLEFGLRLPMGGWLDRWEMQRKMRKFEPVMLTAAEADFSADWCKGHFDGHMNRILNAYQDRVDAIIPAIQSKSKPKVLFGQSYYLRFDTKLWDAMQPYPPLGTLYAASFIREKGYEVALFDAMLAESEVEWEQMLIREKPHYAVIFEDNFNYLSKMCLSRMRDAAFTMIQTAKAQGCMVIVCGSDATDHAADYLGQGANYVLLGEGEETLAELLAALSDSSLEIAPETVVGVVSPTQTDSSQRRAVMRELDSLPQPAWDLVDVDRYRRIWLERHSYYSMNVVTTRGCPYHCNWCAKPIWGQRYNVHSPEYVVEQIKSLKMQFNPDHIWFADDILGLKPGWLERFADLMEAEQMNLPFKCLSRADLLLRGDTIKALKRAGCDIVWIGAESGSQKVLDAMEKGTRVEQIQETASRLHEVGVKVGFFLQFGYPGETRADIASTLQLVRDCQPDDIGISVSYPLPGTTFYQRVKDELGVQQNWEESNDMAMLYHGPFTTAFYRKLHTIVHKEFRS